MRYMIVASGALLLAGCATTAPSSAPRPAVTRPAATTTAAAPTRARPARKPSRAAVPLALPGLEAVIGSTSAGLTRMFGAPRLDIVEGDARKLQFSGGACVLDAYLYPPAPGREPETTYIDARLPDGRDTDRVACVTALRGR